jgi:putative glycosyltransferase (TIGR04348 family)
MNVRIVAPSSRLHLIGNELTARRYARILSDLGHRTRVSERFNGESCDIMVALHARRSFASIRNYRKVKPRAPLVVVLTGTDVYRDIASHSAAQQALEMATRLVVLQRDGMGRIPACFRVKTRVIYQSALSQSPGRGSAEFKIAVIGHMRKEKDPFRAPLAARMLPVSSRVDVLHVGRPLNAAMRRRAIRETNRNPRYRWLGELPNWRTRRLMAGCKAVAVTSLMEGGSNVLCEALASGVPVLASRIPGLLGTLGNRYPGYFPAGDTASLAKLMWRAESDKEFYRSLKSHCAGLKPLVSPAREKKCWRSLMAELMREIE